MNNKDFILSVGIIVALIVNGLVNVNPLLNMQYYQDAAAQSSPMLSTNASAALSNNNATSNFLTYENSTYGIKLQYPSDWLYKEGENAASSNNNNNTIANSSSASLPVQTIVNFGPNKDPIITYLKIGVIDLNTRALTVDVLANILMANKAQVFPGIDVSKLNSTILAGSPAYKFVLTSSQKDGKVLNYFTVKDTKAYLIAYFVNSTETYSTYLPTAQKMIDSLQILGNGTISQKGQTSSLQQLNSTNQNSTGDIRNYLKYNGNNFSLQYPAGWKIEQSDIGVPGGEAIRLSNSQFSELIQVVLTPTDIESLKNATQAEIDSHLEQIFPTLVKAILSGIKNGILVELQNPVYDKYVVDGHKVGTTNFTHNYSGLLFKSIAVGAIVGRDVFLSTYHAPANVFDQNLPIFENIIKSIRFVDASSSQTNVSQQQPTLSPKYQ